jgi:hypothetical protein
MTDEQQQELLRQMHDAVPLSHDHPMRRAVVRRVARSPEWAERVWLDLVAEQEALRIAAWRVPANPGLKHRLLALPDHFRALSRGRGRWIGRWVGIAALFAIVAGSWKWIVPSASLHTASADLLAQRAYEHHNLRHPMTLATHDPSAVAERFAPQLAWPVRLPDMPAEYRLTGATLCELNGRRVVCTRWTARGVTQSVFQVNPADHDLPNQLDRQSFRFPSGSDQPPATAWLWVVDGAAYVAVEDQPPSTTTSHALPPHSTARIMFSAVQTRNSSSSRSLVSTASPRI